MSKFFNYICYIKNKLHMPVIFSWITILFKKPKSIKFFIAWKNSLKPQKDALLDEVPWVTFESREWLDHFLKQNMNVFEWGSGGSTIYISARVKKIISVEHNSEWYSRVSFKLKEKNISNNEYFLKEPKIITEKIKQILGGYRSTDNFYNDLSFKDYCSVIDSYNDNFFDLVSVDGRARLSCIYHAINKVKRGGYLLLDNSERKEYIEGINLLKNWERKDFYGPGPYNLEFWQTSIFRKI